jgi:hypothetical protein
MAVKAAAASSSTSAGAVGSNNPFPSADALRAVTRTHPRYDQWWADWVGLGYVYEGDGPYLDGSALIPHSRELLYAKDSNNKVDFNTPIGEQRKFIQR